MLRQRVQKDRRLQGDARPMRPPLQQERIPFARLLHRGGLLLLRQRTSVNNNDRQHNVNNDDVDRYLYNYVFNNNFDRQHYVNNNNVDRQHYAYNNNVDRQHYVFNNNVDRYVYNNVNNNDNNSRPMQRHSGLRVPEGRVPPQLSTGHSGASRMRGSLCVLCA